MKADLAHPTGLFDPLSHILSPTYEILSEDRRGEVLRTYRIKPYNLPKILITDPAMKATGAKIGDIIKITRKTETAGTTISYRLVVSE